LFYETIGGEGEGIRESNSEMSRGRREGGESRGEERRK
jgi:hypothetical protein